MRKRPSDTHWLPSPTAIHALHPGSAHLAMLRCSPVHVADSTRTPRGRFRGRLLLSSHPAPLALLNGCMWISQPPAAGRQPPATLDCLDCLDSSCPCIGRRGFGALPADYLPLSNSQRQSPSCSPACRYSNLPCRQRPPRPPHPQGIGLDIVCRHLGMPNDTASRQRHYVRSWRCTTRSVLSCADHTELHVTLMASSAPLMHHTHLPLSGSR
jgi:hypothetical protein